MANHRMDRINEQLREELSQILRGVKDRRVGRALVSITHVDCAADLKTAKIYFSAVGMEPAEVRAGLKSASGYIRGQLAQRVNLRITPELTFIADSSLAHGAHITELLYQIGAQRDAAAAAESADSADTSDSADTAADDGGEERV